MIKNFLSAAALFASASLATAQTCTISMNNGWAIVGSPANQQVINNFSVTAPGSFLQGGASATVQMPGYLIGAATVQGYTTTGNALSVTRTATAGGITYFSKSGAPGTAAVRATIAAGPMQSLSRGVGASGTAQASAAFTCPLFGWLTGSAVASWTTGGAIGVLSTAPQTAIATASGLTTFQINASAGATASGSLGALGDGMQLNSNMYGTVAVNLN